MSVEIVYGPCKDIKQSFQYTFGEPLSRFWGLHTGFALERFGQHVGVRTGEDIYAAVSRVYGKKAVELLRFVVKNG